MKSIKILCSLLLVLMVCSAFSLKGSKGKSVYIVGVSASFTDSLVYFTEIQLLDSVRLDKNKMLPERSQYSYQLKNYLENEEGLTNRTCFVYFSNSRKKLQKTINKMKIKYQKGKTLLIREVNPNAFKFKKPEELSFSYEKDSIYIFNSLLFLLLREGNNRDSSATCRKNGPGFLLGG